MEEALYAGSLKRGDVGQSLAYPGAGRSGRQSRPQQNPYLGL